MFRRTTLATVVLCVASLVATIVIGASAQEGEEEDEFAPRPDPVFTRSPEPVLAHNSNNNNNAGAWSDGKLSLRDLLSFQWARQDIELGNLEYLALCVMVAYATAFVLGRRRNHEIANSFIKGVHGLFCSRFLEAGPASEVPPQDRRQLLARESCSSFLYYATGSRSCSGVLVRINLCKRHDLFMLIWNVFTPSKDTVTIEVSLDDDDIEPMVFAVTRKRDVKKLLQDVPHLQDYAGIIRAPSLPPGLVCLSETGVLLDPLLTPHAVKILSETSDLLELMHFTDQNEQPVLGQKETPRKMLRFKFRLPVVSGKRTGDLRGAAMMVELALYYIELLHKFKMYPGMRKKALERRDTIAKRKFKMTHAQRQERFQQLKTERLQREREEYENLTPEQKRRRDLRDEKKAKKATSNKKLKMKLSKA